MGYDGEVTIKIDAETKSFEEEIKQTEEYLNKLVSSYEKAANMKGKLKPNEQAMANLRKEIEKTNNKLVDLKQKQENLNRTDLSEAEKKVNKVGNSVSSVIKKISKWSLAIFGIRSAYNAIRNAMSLVEGNNEKIANQINTMKMAVANALTPVIQKILDLVKTLMLYINYIAFRLTGKNLFDFTKAFKDANKNSAETAKNVGKMTAGFDEMNVINDTSASSSGGSGAGSLENPFENWENFEPPKWLVIVTDVLDWIKTNWKAIVVAILAIGSAFLIFKGFQFFKDLFSKKTADDIATAGTSFTGFFDAVGKGIEAIAILGGLALVIYAVTDMINTFSESGLKVTDVLGLMGTIIGSLVVLITSLTVATQFLQSPLAMAGLAVLTASISTILLVISVTLPTILDALSKFIVNVGPTLNKILETIGTNISIIIYALGTSLPPIINSVGDLFEKIFNGISKVVSAVGGVIVSVLNTAKSLVTTVLKSILDFINKLGPAINNFVDNAIKAVTKLINFMISGIEYLVNTLIVKGINKIIKAVNSVAEYVGITIPVVPEFSIPKFVPKLAVGGIVNMPGKGVPIGGAITGEVSKEGVIPLTDSQAMQELGQTIGKYITINANITNTMNGRVISRELQKINTNNDFAFNR
jgi:phage-related protein